MSFEELEEYITQYAWAYFRDNIDTQPTIDSFDNAIAALKSTFQEQMRAESNFTTSAGYTEVSTEFVDIDIVCTPATPRVGELHPKSKEIAPTPRDSHNVAGLEYSMVLTIKLAFDVKFIPHSVERDTRILREYAKYEKLITTNKESEALELFVSALDEDNPFKFTDTDNTKTKRIDIDRNLSVTIPMLVGADGCSIKEMTRKERYEAGEDPDDLCGYFCGDGKEYTVRGLSSYPQNPAIIDPTYKRGDVVVHGIIRAQPNVMYGMVRETVPIVITKNSEELLKLHISSNAGNKRYIKQEVNDANYTKPNRLSFRDIFLLLGAKNDEEIISMVAPNQDTAVINWLRTAFNAEVEEYVELEHRFPLARNIVESAFRFRDVITSDVLYNVINEELEIFRDNLPESHPIKMSDAKFKQFAAWYTDYRTIENVGIVLRMFLYPHAGSIRGRLEAHAVLTRRLALYSLGRLKTISKTEMNYIRSQLLGTQLMRSLRAAFNDTISDKIRKMFREQILTMQESNFDQRTSALSDAIIVDSKKLFANFNNDIAARIRGTKGEVSLLYTNMRNVRGQITTAESALMIVNRQSLKNMQRVSIRDKVYRASHSYFLCPMACPEYGNAGVQPIPTMYARFTMTRSNIPIEYFITNAYEKYKDFTLISDETIGYDPESVVIQVNHRPFARIHRDAVPRALMTALEARSHGKDAPDYAVPKSKDDHGMELSATRIAYDTSVYYDLEMDTLNFDTDGGAVLIPVIRKSVLYDKDLLAALKNNSLITGRKTKCKTREEYLAALETRMSWYEFEEKKWVEWYTMPMLNCAIVAMSMSQMISEPERYTHVILPWGFLAKSIALNPLINRMRLIRGALHYSHTKGASSSMTPYLMSADHGKDKRKRLITCSQPVFTSEAFDAANQNGIFCFERGAFAAIMRVGGNQMDGQVVSKAMCEHGLYATQYFSTISRDETEHSSMTTMRPDIRSSLRHPEKYLHIPDGADKASIRGTKLFNGMPAFCEFGVPKHAGGQYSDRSQVYDGADNYHMRIPIPARVIYSPMNSRLVTHTIVPLEAGDKISAYANKATINEIWEEWEMPRTQHGTPVSVIANYDAIIRRETHSYELAALVNTMGMFTGKQIVFDTFKWTDANMMTALGKLLSGVTFDKVTDEDNMADEVKAWYGKLLKHELDPKSEDFTTMRTSPFGGVPYLHEEKALLQDGLKLKEYDPKTMPQVQGHLYIPNFRSYTDCSVLTLGLSQIKHPQLAAPLAHARDDIDKRNFITYQAPASQKHRGGDKLGPMERNAMATHGGAHLIRDSYTERGSGRPYLICKRCGSFTCYRNPETHKIVCHECKTISDDMVEEHVAPTSLRNLEGYSQVMCMNLKIQ